MYSWFPFVNRFVLITLPYVLSFQSPDGYTVVSAAADETLRFWKISRAPDTSKNDNTKDIKVAFNKFHSHIH